MTNNNKKSIAIIGAGNGGCAFACYLVANGHKVTLYSQIDHSKNLKQIIIQGGIIAEGIIKGFFKINTLTNNICEAVSHVDIILFTIPSYAQVNMFQNMLQYLKNGQIIVSMPGNFASLYYSKINNNFHSKKLLFVDLISLPFGCRLINYGKINIINIKKNMMLGCYTQNTKAKIEKILSNIIPNKLRFCDNVIAVGLNCISAIIHPATALLNTGWIETTKGDFYFYKQGVSKSISKLLEKIDNERISIAKAYNILAPSFLDIVKELYEQDYENIFDFAQNSLVHNTMKVCPNKMTDRYITEEVAYVLIPYLSLAKMKNIATPNIKLIIDIACNINQINYYKEGRDLIEYQAEINKILANKQ